MMKTECFAAMLTIALLAGAAGAAPRRQFITLEELKPLETGYGMLTNSPAPWNLVLGAGLPVPPCILPD